jgi:DNA helicase II / ATP-dependent DNA helicase PcrA
VLYLGDVFERPEVRDMLALLELACEPDGRGLVRVARFPEYHTPLGDVRALRQLASDKRIPFPRALRLAASAEGITEEGKRGLALLERHLDGLSYGIQPWTLLVNYLFVRSHYLREVVADMSVVGQQRRLALAAR